MRVYLRRQRIQRLLVQATLVVSVGSLLAHPAFASGSATPHVRSHSATITAVIRQASERSETFRTLIDIIEASDGIVYIEEGRCSRVVRACLVTVTPAGAGFRMLRVRVDIRRRDADLISAIGHELYHVTEVLSHRLVTTGAAMYSMYSRIGRLADGIGFETEEAIRAGAAVRHEWLAIRSSR
jgi:hypothetical protein